MPEIAEVELVRLGLERLQGQELRDLEVSTRKLGIAGREIELLGCRVVDLRRKGKLLGIELDHGDVIAIHLRMTGNLSFAEAPGWRVRFAFNDDTLFFDDPRGFGTVDVLGAGEFGTRLGPDLFSADLKAIASDPKHSSSRRAAKAVLLDQAVVAGIGNYIADESLWRCSINPTARWSALSVEQRLALLEAAAEIGRQALEHGGVTIRDYRRPDGQAGEMQLLLECYGRVGQPCLRCGEALDKTKVAGRGTTFCPRCQA